MSRSHPHPGADLIIQAEVDPTRIVARYSVHRQLTVNQSADRAGSGGSHLQGDFRDASRQDLFVIGAASLRYGEVMLVIDAARAGGVDRVGIVTAGK